MMKRLKFSEPLPRLVLSKKKDTTWRINDDKNIELNDNLLLCYSNGEEFAKAKVIWVKMNTFENLTLEDKEGHEAFSSDEEMYRTYSRYYNIKVNPKTELKIIKFRVTS